MRIVSVPCTKQFQGTFTVKPANYASLVSKKEPQVAESINSLKNFVERRLPDDMVFYATLYNTKSGEVPTKITPYSGMALNIRREGDEHPSLYLSGDALNKRNLVPTKQKLVEISNQYSAEIIDMPTKLELYQ